MLLLIVVMFWSGYEYGQRRFVEIGGVQIKQIDGEWWARVSGNSDAPAIEIGSGEMLVHSCIVDVASSRPSTQPTGVESMAEIPKIKTPVQCGCHEGEYGGTVGIRDADGDAICCDAADYINATEAALRELSKLVKNAVPLTVGDIDRLGLWREPQ